jgi:hypothetical protein
MDAMSYVNIFETKGLEYLLVISFLLGFLLLVRFLTPREESIARKAPAASSGPPMTCVADFECPFRTHPTDASEGETDPREEDVVA